MIDWETGESHVLLNPRLPPEQSKVLNQSEMLHSAFPGHLWLTSSGTSGHVKLVGLSKQAILVSAAAVNRHLQSDHSDRWLNPLPLFHVGGLSILARAHLSGAAVFQLPAKWDAHEFVQSLHRHQATLTSLVPTQLYDLVIQKREAPQELRAMIVGGGALSPKLYQEGRKLGWPLLPSYGMTECASQIATATLESPDLKVLSHINLKIAERGFLAISSSSLLTTYAYMKGDSLHLVDPKQEGWFETEDVGTLDEGGTLHVKGRGEDSIKIGGELVSIIRLQNVLDSLKMRHPEAPDMALFASPDERLGYVIHLAATEAGKDLLPAILEAYHAEVMPVEKIRKVHFLPEIPRSPLGKILRCEIRCEII